MTDSLADILGRKSHNTPREVTAIKSFIQKELNVDVSVSLGKTQLVIVAPNGSVATVLRMRQRELQQVARTKLRIIIRIS